MGVWGNPRPRVTFAPGAHGQDERDEQVEQHALPTLLIGERGDHMTQGEVLLQGLGRNTDSE